MSMGIDGVMDRESFVASAKAGKAGRDDDLTAHTRRGIDQAEGDAVHYRINGKTPAERRAANEEQARLARIASMMDGRLE
jgi:hypothetical protein